MSLQLIFDVALANAAIEMLAKDRPDRLLSGIFRDNLIFDVLLLDKTLIHFEGSECLTDRPSRLLDHRCRSSFFVRIVEDVKDALRAVLIHQLRKVSLHSADVVDTC